MSGIAGIIRFDGGPVDADIIARMTSRMAHRGPDGIRHWVKGSVGLGHCLLRTTPESLEESQPLTNEDESLVLVMDGWLENWVELRQELLDKGARLRTRADGELVLRAYETWGEDCLAHIDGDFAFVIWDARQNRAFAARDHFGMKPLNYMWDGATFVFASEPRPVLDRPGVTRVLNEGMVAEFIANDWFTRNETFWAGLNRLVPAHAMTVSGRGTRIGRYWWPDLSRRLTYKRDEDYLEHYREVFAECQRRASRSHARVAYEVSGGHDSTANFCMAAKLQREGLLLAPGMDGYHIAYRGDPRADETAYARDAAEVSGIPVGFIEPYHAPQGWFRHRVEQTWDFPGYPNGTASTGLWSQLQQRGTRVVINGEGGDECLAGTRTYYAEALLDRDWQSFAQSFSADRAAFGSGQAVYWVARHGLFRSLPLGLQDAIRSFSTAELRHPLRNPQWLSDRLRKILAQRRRDRPRIAMATSRPGQKGLLVGLQNAFSDHMMEDTDRLTARIGIEARSPMLSKRFLQFAVLLPERMRLSGNTDKYLHIMALSHVLPDSVAKRRTKANFISTFRSQLHDNASVMAIMDELSSANWLSRREFSALLAKGRNNPLLGWPEWVLWSVYGSALLLDASAGHFDVRAE